MNADDQDRLVRRLVDKIEHHHDIIQLDEDGVDDADVVVCAYGITARVARIATARARSEGIRVGMLRLITVWPFPEERVRQIAGHAGTFVVAEINYGQISLEVERSAAGRAATVLVPHMGGTVHNPVNILEAIRQAVR
jgi:2-oxoglutarate ferredoxin oxidoreductase subunit alpha